MSFCKHGCCDDRVECIFDVAHAASKNQLEALRAELAEVQALAAERLIQLQRIVIERNKAREQLAASKEQLSHPAYQSRTDKIRELQEQLADADRVNELLKARLAESESERIAAIEDRDTSMPAYTASLRDERDAAWDLNVQYRTELRLKNDKIMKLLELRAAKAQARSLAERLKSAVEGSLDVYGDEIEAVIEEVRKLEDKLK
jgi:hypothetical protein